MLHKRFKSAKCKTSLKLATSRIKLMRNKKSVQINQMKKELAQLLETGQDRTARIRVEHVIREEKMIAAYDLIQIYCELILARLPIIESQKTCPIDLKEAIASVTFAAPRCSDISELADIRKQFTAKYGKDFVSAAIELHPDCGVSRMLVEKLSAVAPDLQTKVKVLSAVAKDHNIDWDPTSFEEKESKPQSDLLNGPSNFENASMASVDPPKVQPVHSHEEKPNAPLDLSEQNRKYTRSTQNVTDDSVGETSSSGVTYERMEKRQNWNMEFKDATSAAQAAAESAERAALAARAASQFSNQEKKAGHHSSGLHVSDSIDKPPQYFAHSGSSGESSLDDRKPKISNQHIDHTQHDTSQKATERIDKSNNDSTKDDGKLKISDLHTDQSQHDTSQKANERFDTSNNDSIEDEKMVNNFHKTDGYYEEFLHEDQDGFCYPERESDTKLSTGQKDVIEDENINLFATKNQSTLHSSHAWSGSSGDEVDVCKKSVVGNPFAVVDQESPFKESIKTGPDVYDEVISDDNDDGGGPRFDTGFEYDETETTNSLENAYIWNPKTNTDDKPISLSHIFSESLSFVDQSVKSVEPAETDNHAPATFDDSDGPDSESESELLSMNPESSSVVESSLTYNSIKNRIELNDLVEERPSFEDEEKQMHTQLELKNHNLDQESSDRLEDNDDSPNQRLNFGKLTGGLKHKGGFKYPPYTKSATIKKSTEESSLTGSQTSFQSSLDSKVSRREDTKPKVLIHISDSDSDEKASKQVNTRSWFPPPAAFFDDDEESDLEDKVPKQVPVKARLGSGLSRRTRGSPSVSYSKTHVELEPKPEPESAPITETVILAEPRAYARRFKVEDDEQNSESQQPYRRTVETGKSKLTTLEPQVNHSAHTKQEHTSSRITVDSGKSKNAKTQDLGSEKLLKENLVKKPSHVHPKLPEYDSLAARLQSLRTGHQ